MVNHKQSWFTRRFVLALLLVLSSCDFNPSLIPSESEGSSSEAITSSEDSGSSSSEEGSSSSSSSSESSSISVEIPGEGQTISGMSTAWPQHIIEAIFTSDSRLTIPPFVASSYIYEYAVNPIPGITIAVPTAISDPVSVYTESLMTAGWTIHDEFIGFLGFPVAVDPDSEMMIAYLAESGSIIFNIMLYDAELFEDLGLLESDLWPSADINLYLENTGNDIVVPFPSDDPYFYILPTDENNVFFLMTKATQTGYTSYLSTLMVAGWGIEQDGDVASCSSPNGEAILFLTLANGNITIIIAQGEENEEPEIMTSSAWPAEAVTQFLVGSFLDIPIPTFEANQYYYYFDEDEYNPLLSIFAEYNTSLIDQYVTQAIGAGWTVNPMHEDAGSGYYAIDPKFEILIAIEEYYPYFTVTIWVFSAQLEYYFDAGVASWTDCQSWPSDAIENFLTTMPTVPLPPFSADFYSYRVENDFNGPYLAILASGTSADADAYQQALIAATYHVTTQEVEGTLLTLAWDPDETIMVFFAVLGNQIRFSIREYDSSLFEEEPELPPADTMLWPSFDIGQEFGPSVPGLIPILTSSAGYLVDYSSLDGMAYIEITAIGVTDLELSYYLGMLGSQQFTVLAATGLASEGYYPYIATDSHHTIMMIMGENENGMLIQILPYDETAFNAMIYFESGTTESWPSDLISSTFSESFNSILPSFSEESFYSSTLYYTGAENTPWIQVASEQASLVEVRAYVAALFDANWSLDMVEDEISGVYAYLLYDPTQNVLLIIHFSDGYYPLLTLDFTFYTESAYQNEYDLLFPQEPM